MANWRLSASGSEVVLGLDDGSELVVDAGEIYDVEFEGERIVRGVTVRRPSSDLPDVQFSPHLLRVVPQLHKDEDTRIRLRLVSLAASMDILGVAWPTSDQLILSGIWNALDRGELEQQQRLLSERDIKLGAALDPNDVLWLLAGNGLDVASTLTNEALGGFLGPENAEPFDDTVLQAVLYPYQVAGARFLVQLAALELGALLADEMGLGKTMQGLYLIAHSRKAGLAPHLVIAPSSTLANWEREIKRFAPSLSVYSHSGARRTGDPRMLAGRDIVLTSYDLAVRDRALLESVAWNVVLLDEAQAIKNEKALRSLAVKALTRRSGVAITGTPIENSLADLWSIFEFVAPSQLGSREAFDLLYPDEIDAARALSRRIAPLVLRRTVVQVAQDLPPRVDILTPIYAGERLASLYDEVRTMPGQLPLVTLTRLRQVCASPTIVDEHWGPFSQDFEKHNRLVEILDEIILSNGKALVFASFTETLDQILRTLSLRYNDVFLATVDGRKDARTRQSVIDDFSAFEGSGVLVMNPRAAGVGLNIQAASHVIHFTPEWNPATVAQASARAHRRGQDKPVFVHYLYYVETVEELMMDRLSGKRGLQEAGLSHVSSEPTMSDAMVALKLSPNK